MRPDFKGIVSVARVVLGGLLVGMTFLSIGCVVPRCPFGVSSKAYPSVPVAVLPMEVAPSIDENHYDVSEVQELGDRVLDTLTKSDSDNLIGPGLVRAMLGGTQLPEALKWHHGESSNPGTTNTLNVGFPSGVFLEQKKAPRIQATGSTIAGLQKLSDLLGVHEVMRSSISVLRKAPEDASGAGGGVIGLGVGWEVDVTVQMELINLKTATILRRTSGTGDAGGGAGVILFVLPIPYYADSTLGKGIDHACRAALKRMFEEDGADAGRSEEITIVPLNTP
jgi:hypothetical protein